MSTKRIVPEMYERREVILRGSIYWFTVPMWNCMEWTCYSVSFELELYILVRKREKDGVDFNIWLKISTYLYTCSRRLKLLEFFS